MNGKIINHSALELGFSYFQTKENYEIDLIVEKPRGRPILIEIKSFKKFSRDKVGALFSLNKNIPHDAANVL